MCMDARNFFNFFSRNVAFLAAVKNVVRDPTQLYCIPDAVTRSSHIIRYPTNLVIYRLFKGYLQVSYRYLQVYYFYLNWSSKNIPLAGLGLKRLKIDFKLSVLFRKRMVAICSAKRGARLVRLRASYSLTTR